MAQANTEDAVGGYIFDGSHKTIIDFPFPTTTETELATLGPVISVQEAYERLIMGSARNVESMDRGILSAWSYSGLLKEASNVESNFQKPRSHGDFSGRSLDKASKATTPVVPRASPRTRNPRIVATNTDDPTNDKSGTGKKNRGRPHLGLSPEITAEVMLDHDLIIDRY